MELKAFLKILSKYLLLILAFAILGLIAAYALAKAPQGAQVEQLFFIPPSADSADLQAAYYGQETARNFTDTAVSILESADFRSSVPAQGQITARKVAPQLIRISATANDAGAAKNLMETTINSFNQKFPQKLSAVGQGPHEVIPRPSKHIMLAAGLITGIIFALFVVSIKEYFKV